MRTAIWAIIFSLYCGMLESIGMEIIPIVIVMEFTIIAIIAVLVDVAEVLDKTSIYGE